ncbi:hypothetical protein ACOMICROBIO_GDFFDHBD_04305 [Vibrio sp. B1REV9]|uniref:DUF1127 domain-containing protein n=1 Tax=Vibrio sp. B1REV9 TaxID=2751179 RepID=UPI001B0D7A22|nr:DUF1127 domain-containing protein [Vibrio sp. B1REV9]CAE6964247.1 hypothetical protein ACOMICROBIO_GDFFDHBD_04305 [Vibrio sp. B1REV9]
MRHSIYLKLATLLVKADLIREEKQWQRAVRRSSKNIPWLNAHMLRDMGLDAEGRAILTRTPDEVQVDRRVRHLRRVLTSRILT